MKYRIYRSINIADTCCAPDKFYITELGEAKTLGEAKRVAKEYIENHFSHNSVKLVQNPDGTFSATDFCSYPTTVVVEPSN